MGFGTVHDFQGFERLAIVGYILILDGECIRERMGRYCLVKSVTKEPFSDFWVLLTTLRAFGLSYVCERTLYVSNAYKYNLRFSYGSVFGWSIIIFLHNYDLYLTMANCIKIFLCLR